MAGVGLHDLFGAYLLFFYCPHMFLSLIAAVSDNNVIGRKNDLPWHLPAELKWFKALTTGHPVIMGRKTCESILARRGSMLPNRHNIIVSRSMEQKPDGADVVASIDEAMLLAERDGAGEAFIIGGERMYAEGLAKAHKLYLTRVHTVIEDGDAFFPEFNEGEWTITQSERHEADAENPIAFTMMVYERKRI